MEPTVGAESRGAAVSACDTTSVSLFRKVTTCPSLPGESQFRPAGPAQLLIALPSTLQSFLVQMTNYPVTALQLELTQGPPATPRCPQEPSQQSALV